MFPPERHDLPRAKDESSVVVRSSSDSVKNIGSWMRSCEYLAESPGKWISLLKRSLALEAKIETGLASIRGGKQSEGQWSLTGNYGQIKAHLHHA